MNKCIIIGNLTRDPEVATANGGKTVCTFTVAVNKRTGGSHPEATYFRVAAWEQLAETCRQYLSKGKKVCVVGSIDARPYMSNSGECRASLEVTAREVEFLTPRADSAQAVAQAVTSAAPQMASPEAPQPVDDEDCPW